MRGLLRNQKVVLTCGILILLAYHFFSPTSEKSSEAATKSRVTDPLSTSRQESNGSVVGPGSQSDSHIDPLNSLGSYDSDNNLSDHASTVAQVRQEVVENPHETPLSIIEFAAELGPKMELALQSEAVALQLFEKLKEGALQFTLPVTIQAICLSNAQVLAKNYPKLESSFGALKVQANPEAVRLITFRE